MLDLTGILFSSLMMLFVIVQAVRLDAARPWFEGPPKAPADKLAAINIAYEAVRRERDIK